MNIYSKAKFVFYILWALPLAAEADFKPALARMALDRDRVLPGGTLQATYTFRSSGPASVDLEVFVHVVRPDGRHLGADFSPDLPTTEWPAEGFVREGPFPIAVPTDAAPGRYRILVGFFSPASGARSALDNADRDQGDREYLAGEFEVTAPGDKPEAKEVRFELLPVNGKELIRAPAPPASQSARSQDPAAKYYDWRKARKPERPYLHPYHQTVVMKIFLAEKQPNEGCKVHLTFEQALEVIRKLDNLTLGVPKIVYLVGWQHNGHDSKYPDWSVVNPRLKRPQDATALDSLKWLMEEGFKHHTTVSLHINMFDATAESPLWDTYLKNDIIAKDKDGKPLPGEVFGAWTGPDTQSYQISYAREWETGFAQKRIDALLAMLPIQEAGTIHIDAFHSMTPIPHAYPQERYPNRSKADKRISPFLGCSLEKEVEAQRRIFRYWRDKGVDVTSEGSGFLRPDAFVGLQPMAWHYSAPAPGIPASLYCGTPMQAEREIGQDPLNLTGLKEQFCLRVVPWYYENNTTAAKGSQRMRDGDDLCMLALWREKTLIAYSRKGHGQRQWQLPPDWKDVHRVAIRDIELDGSGALQEMEVVDNTVSLSLKPGQGVSIVPAGEPKPGMVPALKLTVTDFGAKPDDDQDDTAAILSAIEKVRQAPGSILVFPKGQYDLKNPKALADWQRMITAAKPGQERWRGAPPAGFEGWPADKNSILRLVGGRDLIIDGQGSTLLAHGLCQTILVQDCRNVVIRNFKMDWRQPPFMTGKVLACQGRSIEVEVLDDVPVAGGEPFIAFQVYDPKTKLATSLETFAGVQSTELLRPKVLRLNLTRDGRGDIVAGKVPVGHLLVMRHILSGYEPIEIRESSRVRLEDVDLYTGAGMGILGVGARDLTLLRVRIIPKPDTSRLMSTTADGTHFINCAGTIELKDCTLAGEGDDHLNLHGQYQFVEKRLDDRTIDGRIGTRSGFGQWSDCFVNGWMAESKPGDRVEFFRLNDLAPFGEAEIEALVFNRKTGRSRVTFKQSLPPQLKEEDVFQNQNLIPRLRVSGCTLGPNRARGLLVTTRDVVIENNTFDRLGGTAIFVCCEVDWLEAPAPANVVIRGNRFADCGYAVANEGGGAITMLFKQGQNIKGTIQDVRIEENTFRGTHGAGISGHQLDGLSVRKNTFIRYNPAVVLRASRNAQVRENILQEGSRRIVVDPSCESQTVGVQENQEAALPATPVITSQGNAEADRTNVAPRASAVGFRPAIARLELDRDRVQPDGTVQATYTFRSSGPAPVELEVFVHVVRPDGRHIGADFSPDLPATEWPTNGFVREGPFPIAVPADAAPGKYQVWVGLFSSTERIEFENAERLRGSREYHVGEFEVVAAGSTVAPKPAVFDWLPVDETKVAKAPPMVLQPGARTLERLTVSIDRKVLNPVRETKATANLTLTVFYSDGSSRALRCSEAKIRAWTKSASGNVEVVAIEGDQVVAKEGGIATIEAVVAQEGRRLKATTDVVVAPFYRDYHQTLVLKLFLGMEGTPVERLAREPMFQKPHDVICTFEEALEVVRKADNLTRGIPKIVYLVGWQKGGHDHGYPAWDEVNPRMKRKQDATALESLRWLIREARTFNTTVSLHINMADAYQQSPLWDEYLAKDCLAKDERGQPYTLGIQMKGEDMYNVVYPKEWEAGLTQRRIDGLIKMIPELKDGHTIHIDVFIANRDGGRPISPWHAKPENGGLTPDKYVETQRKIFHYWRDRGFDVTGEGTGWAHPPGEHFVGLQGMSWWYSWNPMEIPEYLGARGRTDRGGDGDFRFGSSMHGEEIWQKDKENMPGFLGMFCRTTLPWYYMSRLERKKFENDALYYSDGVVARTEEGRKIIRKGDFVLRENDDLFVPALWRKKNEIIAYSRDGYENKSWLLPDNWKDVKSVDVYKITPEGCVPLKKDVPVTGGKLSMSIGKDEAVSVVPAGTKLSEESR